MEKFLVSIRLLFFLAVTVITFMATRPHGYGWIGRKVRAAEQRFHNFHERMKTSLNARKYFLFIVEIFLIGIQFIDYTLLTDYHYYSAYFMCPTAQFFLCWILTLMLFPFGRGYKFADRLYSTYNRSRKGFGAYACCELILVFSPFMLMADVGLIILIAMIMYPDMVAIPDPKGRKPIPIQEEKRELKKAA